MAAGAPELTIILAEAKDNPDPAPALRAIEVACAHFCVEVLLVRPAGQRPAHPPDGMALRELSVTPELLVNERWAYGVRAAAAPLFACLTTELMVAPTWATALIAAMTDDVVGASGALALAGHGSNVEAAVYLTRFNAFLPGPSTVFRVVHNIPGDGAMYRSHSVRALPNLLDEGFWEADFHHRFRKLGLSLRYTDAALVGFQSRVSLRHALVVRFRHGRGFGVTRVTKHRQHPARVVAAVPFVPFVLLGRLLSRVRKSPDARANVARGFPVAVALAVAWAVGEGMGAVDAWSAR